MTVIQEMCGRIGMVTGRGLSGVIKRNYSRKVLYISVLLLLIANTVNIGANLGAMASSVQLFLGGNFLLLLFIMVIIILSLEILLPYRTYARVLKFLTFSLFAYIIAALVVKQEWNEVIFSTFVPSLSFNKDYIFNIVAILGTTISPYLFFWEADEEVEEEIAKKRIVSSGKGMPLVSKLDIRKMRIDTVAGMFFSNLVMFFIIMTTASTLGRAGITEIKTATDAAEALRPIAGELTYLLFASGIIGTGFLAVPILAGSASYAVSEAFGFRAGLSEKFNKAKIFYLIIILSTLVGLLVNFSPIQPFQMLYYTAVLNGLCAPPLMVLIMLVAGNKKIMGNYTNSLPINIMGWAITGIMLFASAFLLISFFFW